jgi:hypothetical protein
LNFAEWPFEYNPITQVWEVKLEEMAKRRISEREWLLNGY